MRMILSHARVGWLASVRIAEGITIFEQEVEKKDMSASGLFHCKKEEGMFTMQKCPSAQNIRK